jgi:tetratricopeptide (TPR) repeat protein
MGTPIASPALRAMSDGGLLAMKHRVLVISFLGLILSVPLLAETPGQTVVGQIVFENNSMVCASCEVQLETMEKRVVATETVGLSGRFAFDNVAPDSYLIRVKMSGFEEVDQRVDVHEVYVAGQNSIILLKELQTAGGKVPSSNEGYRVHVSQLTEQYPKKAVSLYNKALKNRKNNKVDLALRQLEEAVAIAPGFYGALHELALLYNKAGRQKDAERALLKAHHVNPKAVEPLVNLTGLYLKSDELERAVETGKQAVNVDPKCASAFVNLGLALYRAADLTEAERALKKALDLDSNMPKVQVVLTNIHLQLQLNGQVKGQLAR